MIIFEDIAPLRAHVTELKRNQRTLAFVPTMGALHKGHEALITHAKSLADDVFVSIFLNPTQFGPNEDLNSYPKPIDKDIEICKRLQIQGLFLPSVETIYPANGLLTNVSLPSLATLYCGASRPQFFNGVTNVVIRLFNIVNPDTAIFGEKDFQQFIILKTCVENLFLPIRMVCHPIIRESSGLAMSSRNAYLTDKQRHEASSIYQSLLVLKEAISNGIVTDLELKELFTKSLASSITIDYLAFVDAQSLAPVSTLCRGNRILFAGYLNKTRLIDTIDV